MNEQRTQEEIDVAEAQIGRILHFVIYDNGRSQCRPAIIVHDWPDRGMPGYVNLVVFPDGTNDGLYGTDVHKHHLGAEHSPQFTAMANLSLLTRWETSVLPNHAVKAVRSWHWPRECHKLESPAMPYRETETDLVYHHMHGPDLIDVNNCLACKLEHKAIK